MSKLLRERLLAQREVLEAAMVALRAVGAGAAASAPAGQQEALDASLPDQAPPAIPHALLLALIGMDDAGLRREFDAHADLAADDKGERRMSKAGLASFMHGQGLAHGDAEVERFLARVDANKDGEIDFSEFCALARSNSDLEKVLQSKRLECILCAFFPSGTTLEDLATMERSQFAAIVDLSKPALVQLLVDLATQVAAVGKAQDGAGGGKFSGELKGGPLDDFYKGVTGVCGEPDADIEKGMREEHTMLPGSDDEFSTPNYGLTTTPSKEWALVLEGGSGCAEVEGKEGSVSVTGTRGCCKASGLKWLNTGNADPTWALGSKWQAVGDSAPTLFRGEAGAVQVDVKERTVAFTGSFATVRSGQRCPLGGKGYYEIEILEIDNTAPQYGFAAPAFGRVLGASGEGVGDDAHSWAVDGTRQNKWHKGGKAWKCKWQIGDVIGLACDLDKMQMHVSLNGSFAAPNGVVFELAPDAVGDGLFAAFSGKTGKVCFNFGQEPFRHAPPAADYKAYDTFAEGRQLTNSMLADALASKKAKVVDFTKEDLDKFGITDLRSTDFIEAGGSYFKPLASTAEILANPALAEALLHKTEFTQQEWDAFGVDGLRMHHIVKSGDSFFHPAGETQPDVRVLRPIACYGDFGDDGRLRWVLGDEVVVGEAFTVWGTKEVAKDTEGRVLEFNAEGAAKIAFREPVSAEPWVPKDQFYRLFPLPNALDTPIQRLVKLARLRRCDVLALVLYTGPLFVIYNAILRGFGFCGAVAEGIEFGSKEFWDQFNAKKIDAWVERSGHKFTNTVHALASAIKKLQGLAAEEPSTRLYRGLGGLSVAKFAASLGFTDKAFMSTTKDRNIALEYSGVHKGLVGTVLCIVTSTTNNGAVLLRFSQYPEEEETVWNACSFLQHLPGREEVVLPPGGGVVRIYHVLVSANSRAETVEELEGRRKRVVVQVLNTLHADVCRAVDAAAKTAEFKARVSQDKAGTYKDYFINSIKDESAERVAVYKALPDGAYAEIEVVGEAVSKGLTLPVLTNSKLRLWLEDTSLDLMTVGNKNYSSYLGLDAAQGRRLARRRRLLQHSSASGRRGSTDRVGRIVVEDGLGRMGGTGTAALALEDCRERRLVTGAGAAALERRDPFSGETPLLTEVQLGEHEHVERLLQAGADANAATAATAGERALLIAAKAGREDLVELLADFKADLDKRYAVGMTALHWASREGHLAVVQVLLKVGADVEAKNHSGTTPLDLAENDEVKTALREHGAKHSLFYAVDRSSLRGMVELVADLIKEGADVNEKEHYGRTSLHVASARGHAAVVQTLLQHGADVAARDGGGKTPLDSAGEWGRDEVKTVLREHGAKHSLFYAAEQDMVELVADLIKEGSDVNEKEHYGRTSLHLASLYGHAAVVQTLLQHGADVAALNEGGQTPLDEAEYCNDVVKKEEVKAVFAKHSLLLAAQVGAAELAP